MEALGLPLMIGGTALSTYGTLAEGKELAEQGQIQQRQYQAEANAALMSGSEAALQKRKEARRLLATQVAMGGKLSGSKLIVMADSAREAEMDALTIERNAGVRAGSLIQAGQMARYEGQLYKRNAGIRAFSNLAGSLGRSYMMYKYYNPATHKPGLSAENKATLYGGRY